MHKKAMTEESTMVSELLNRRIDSDKWEWADAEDNIVIMLETIEKRDLPLTYWLTIWV